MAKKSKEEISLDISNYWTSSDLFTESNNKCGTLVAFDWVDDYLTEINTNIDLDTPELENFKFNIFVDFLKKNNFTFVLGLRNISFEDNPSEEWTGKLRESLKVEEIDYEEYVIDQWPAKIPKFDVPDNIFILRYSYDEYCQVDNLASNPYLFEEVMEESEWKSYYKDIVSIEKNRVIVLCSDIENLVLNEKYIKSYFKEFDSTETEELYNPYLKKSISKRYIECVGDKTTFPVQHMQDALNSLEYDTSDFSLLDVGCGTGNISKDKSIKRFKNYTGVDPSEEFIDYANRYNRNSNFYKGSVENLPFEDNSFDFIISTDTWFYIKDVNVAAQEISRVLKNNSNFIIYTRNPSLILNWSQIGRIISESDSEMKVHSIIKAPGFSTCDLGEHYFSKLSLDDLIGSFENSNLKIVELEKYEYGRIMIQGKKEYEKIS